MKVHVLRARSDNYIYVVAFPSGQAVVVDPCDETIVLRMLEKEGLQLSIILATHHHSDHVAGIDGLKEKTGCTVYGPESRRIPGVDHVVGQGQEIVCEDQRIVVLATPGHTQTSVCYTLYPPEKDPLLFSGDTLFVGGCGRLFECSGETMWESLQRLMDLPDQTHIYCGHEYTLDNLAFAESIDPGDDTVQQAVACVRRKVQEHGLSVPSTMGWERQANIFLRARAAAIGETLGLAHAQPAQVFSELRRRKDRF